MNNNDYCDFEEKFRGSRDQVIKRLGIYDGLLKTLAGEISQPSILDLGCGRGEWLEKCNSQGFLTHGIERNSCMVETCNKLGLRVSCGDALEVLNELSENSYSMVTAFHLAEHLENNYMLNLLKLCRKVISPNGILLLETPSIDNLSVSSKLFYSDPTHISPINADTTVFTLEQLGFHQAEYYYINAGPLHHSDNHHLTRIFNGVAQDVCILAANSKESSKIYFSKENQWTESLEIGLSTLDACLEFDICTNKLKERVTEQEQVIFYLRQRLASLEQQMLQIKSINSNKPFFIRLIHKIIFIIPIPFKSIRKVPIESIKLILKLPIHRGFSRLLISSRIGLKFSYFAIRIMRKLGFREYADKYLNKFNEFRKISSFSEKSNEKLICQYNESSIAKEIYRDLSS